MSRGRADQRHILSLQTDKSIFYREALAHNLLSNHILAGLQIVNVGGDIDVQAPILLLHLLCVDLTHVAASVGLHN